MVIKMHSMQDCAIEIEKNGYQGQVELTTTTRILTKVSNDCLNDTLADNIKDILEDKSGFYEPVIPFCVKATIDEDNIAKVKAIVPLTKDYFRRENYALVLERQVFRGLTLADYAHTEITAKKKFFKSARQLPHPDEFGFNIEINDIVAYHDVLWITEDVTNLRIKLHRLVWNDKKSCLVKYDVIGSNKLIADPTETILVKSANPSKNLVLTGVDINKL
jgi:hypothetical protein